MQWPDRGPSWLKVAETCLAAIEGKAPVEDARAAFEAAARESKKLLG